MTKPIRKYYVGDASVSLLWEDAVDLAIQSRMVVKWSDYDGDQIVGEGGCCVDPDCNCNGSWTHWHDEESE